MMAESSAHSRRFGDLLRHLQFREFAGALYK
jgi:hypothetical protein